MSMCFYYPYLIRLIPVLRSAVPNNDVRAKISPKRGRDWLQLRAVEASSEMERLEGGGHLARS